MNYLTIEEANRLSTKRLLTYYKKYGHNWSSKFVCDCCGEFLWEIYVEHEQDKEEYSKLEKYWNDIKNILDTREHVKLSPPQLKKQQKIKPPRSYFERMKNKYK